MKAYAVVFTPRAERRLARHCLDIADDGGEARAQAYVGKIVAACQALASFPERGGKRDDVRPHLRTMGFTRRDGHSRHPRRVLWRAGDLAARRRG